MTEIIHLQFSRMHEFLESTPVRSPCLRLFEELLTFRAEPISAVREVRHLAFCRLFLEVCKGERRGCLEHRQMALAETSLSRRQMVLALSLLLLALIVVS